MTRLNFLNGCRALIELRPDKYDWRELRFYSAEQLSETLAKEGLSEIPLDTSIPHRQAPSPICKK